MLTGDHEQKPALSHDSTPHKSDKAADLAPIDEVILTLIVHLVPVVWLSTTDWNTCGNMFYYAIRSY